ncbi:aldehyde dehydrogenase family protein [Paraburkholderia edwinii]|jgi:aldehyde dehydrogenase (NAD+)|uniref:aldehyde dehydrogenase (NAD(+)) n=1 Tax=Paraburkholderia edwinii TaxID=2861782 RepID=A0ABX8UW16_9BURK|nr:aldehyde dehydrogenase family protein [Paraburkholderia edwinii]QYD72517.1 aldehyde dehydrogenase family protein [Paraburkholderia edwinii]
MQSIDKIYIDGEFVTPHGEEMFDLFNPATEQVIGRVRLADEHDANRAVAAAKRAFASFSRTSKSERLDMLQSMGNAVAAREDELYEAIVEEYGSPVVRARWMAKYAQTAMAEAAKTLRQYDFTRRINESEVVMQPVGVAGLITPWNANAHFICNKLATAMAAGCTAVIKPSEMSAIQTRIVTEALHEAGVPAGVFNIVTGRGDVVGATMSAHPDIAKISFTGSTAVGKTILRAGADTLKRITLELGGKSPFIVLDDANFEEAVPLALQAGFMNNGQACIAGTRILVPQQRLAEFEMRIRAAAEKTQSGDPRDPATVIGPMVSEKQWNRVQRYIRIGIDEGARLLTGGEGRPDGLKSGWFVRPTVFTDVHNDMTIAREEIFGPVLSIIAYRDLEEAIAIANDTTYGLQAYVVSADAAKAREVVSRIDAGRVMINAITHDPAVPFGGFKQSGIGREMGTMGLEAYLEPKSVMGTF